MASTAVRTVPAAARAAFQEPAETDRIGVDVYGPAGSGGSGYSRSDEIDMSRRMNESDLCLGGREAANVLDAPGDGRHGLAHRRQ